MSYTFVLLPVQKALFDEVKAKLEAGGYGHQVHETHIDMHGLALVEETPAPAVVADDVAELPG